MTIDVDIEAMLDSVIADVLEGEFVTGDVDSDDPNWIHGVEARSRSGEDRAVIIRAGRAWIGAFIPQLGIGAWMVDDDDDVAYEEKELRKLCRALRSYLEGEGDVRQRRRLFGRGSTSVLVLEVDGFEWRFGRRSWVWANPV
jgi:hypothetical protein